MTNDEINALATDFFNAKIAPSVSQDAPTLFPLVDSIEEFARTLLTRAYEEAARMACTGCLNGWKLVPAGTDGQLQHVAYEALFPCRAEGIHALKDLLVENKLHTETKCAV